WQGTVHFENGDTSSTRMLIEPYPASEGGWGAVVRVLGSDERWTSDVHDGDLGREITVSVELSDTLTWIGKGRIQQDGILFGICALERSGHGSLHGIWRMERVTGNILGSRLLRPGP